MGEENESFYDNLILENIRNNQEIPICRNENTPKNQVTGKTPYLPSEKNCKYIRKHGKCKVRISRKFPYKTRKLY